MDGISPEVKFYGCVVVFCLIVFIVGLVTVSSGNNNNGEGEED